MIKKILADSKILRNLVFPILSKLDFKITIRHDFTKRHITMMSWLHKGYWYYGLHREKEEIERFQELIPNGGCVCEIGGHIGYMTQIFEDIVGDKGIVFVAEPTPNSLEFLKKNVLPSTKVLEFAFSNNVGKMNFFTEELGGFTNSLVHEFAESTVNTLSNSQRKATKNLKNILVDVVTIDSFFNDKSYSPDFIKIDVEGAELSVLQGATKTLPDVKNLMVEITRNHKEIYDLLDNFGFKAISNSGKVIPKKDYRGGNIFFIR